MVDSNHTSSLNGRRQRAPTITIDTSAVNNSSLTALSENEALTINNSSQTQTSSINNVSNFETDRPDSSPNNPLPLASLTNCSSGTESRANNLSSSRGRESVPASPNIHISPNASRGEKLSGFLAVPGSRSRQNSIESEDNNQSSTNYSGDTVTNVLVESRDNGQTLTNEEIMKDPEALSPDPGTEEDFTVDENPFAFSQGQLNKIINPKSLSAFYALGGLAGLEKGLRSDRKAGLSIDETTLSGTVSREEALSSAVMKTSYDHTTEPKLPLGPLGSAGSSHCNKDSSRPLEKQFSDRKRVFKDNRLPVKQGKTLLQLMWITFNDTVLILLSVAAAISLGVGLYQTFGTKHNAENPPIEWVEGVAIIVAILIVVVVGSLNDWQKERQFVKLNCKKQDRDVIVIRSGKTMEVSVFDILVGDVMQLESGDMIPVDGVYIDGHNIVCDESQTTGESDLIRKHPADQVYMSIEKDFSLRKLDPFILSGATVVEGVGTFMVTATGVNSSYGKTLMSLREDPEVTPLQSKLNTLAEYIAKLGGGAGLLLFIVLFIKFSINLPKNDATATEKGQQFLQIFIVTVTIIVVAVPEGLPLAVTLALAFATTRMLKDNNLVRHLKACEVMGNATAICSDKTGTLTQNKMLVIAGALGINLQFGDLVKPSNDGKQPEDDATTLGSFRKSSPHEVISSLDPTVKRMLIHSMVVNSTAFESELDGSKTFVGSKTETALLQFANDYMSIAPIDQERSNTDIIQIYPFDSSRKCMGVVVRLDDGKYRLYVKGASEILLQKCTSIIRDPTDKLNSNLLTDGNRSILLNIIDQYATRSLRTIAMVYRDFNKWPINEARTGRSDQSDVKFSEIFKQMVFLGVVGIQDPIRDGVALAVKKCQNAGVFVRMVTGDNVKTAKAIATECGIFTEGGVAMEGPDFRKLSKTSMDQIIPRLQVLARSSPEDKRILVKRLKDLGETVAVTGDGTNDAPALKTADVGFSMGISGTEVAREASAIILMDDNFASIVKAMMWGRAVNDAVKKFLQFQVTVNITAVLLTFITAVGSNEEKSVLTAVQLLWVNLIMDTMAALALATDPPTETILDRKSEPKSASLITIAMWKMIIGESLYQLIITLLLYYGAASIFSYSSPRELGQVSTLVFNTFVWMQIFNQWNNRRLDNKFNIFEGITSNYFFLVINIIMIAGQVMIIFVGGKAFNVVRLSKAQWAYSLVLGFLSIPIGAVIRLIPDELVGRLNPSNLKSRPKGPELTISDEEEHFRFPRPLTDVREELSFLKKVKGGRLNNLKFAIQDKRDQWLPRSRSGSRSRSNSTTPTPCTDSQREDSSIIPHPSPEIRKRARSNRSRSNSALGATTVMAGIIAGSVGGWSPIDRSISDNESVRLARKPDLALNEEIEHPSITKPDHSTTEGQHLDTSGKIGGETS